MCLQETKGCGCLGHTVPEVYHCAPCCDVPHIDATAWCPCRPENGGSGICMCTLGGTKWTC